ncbi:MAG: hypothetical protein ABJD07_07865 [Gemmatimonadaceae bacterium]
MSRITKNGALTSICSLALLALTGAMPAHSGPPWVSIEYPVNPYDATHRGAFLLVREYHHAQQMPGVVTGSAEGLAGGQRRSITLRFDTTSNQSVMALRKQWPDAGTWTLLIHVGQGHEGDGVTAIVDIGSAGEVARVRVPTVKQKGWDIPRVISAGEIDSSLTARAAHR